tara:strand:- start:17 stop:562 length:546 start_codon:yes stop_codon:yes gene_type:complete
MENKESKNLWISRTGKNFDKRFVRAIVKLVEEGVPRRELLKKYSLSLSTLDGWMKEYGSEGYHQSKRRSYSKLQKRTIVTAIEQGRMSLEEARVAYQIKSTDLIRDWIRDFKKEKPDLCKVNASVMATEKSDHNTEDLQALKKALEEAELKIRALNTMIDMAEEQLKIEIRKKSGAKQSQG